MVSLSTRVPKDRLWTAKDDAVTLPKWLGFPEFAIPWTGPLVALLIRSALGDQWLYFLRALFTTYQWQRLVPTSWEIFPNALSTVLQYLSLKFPPNDGWVYYNSLQQLTYFATVFVAAPLAVLTGLMQAPAISNKLGWFGRLFNRQAAR